MENQKIYDNMIALLKRILLQEDNEVEVIVHRGIDQVGKTEGWVETVHNGTQTITIKINGGAQDRSRF